MYFWVHFKIFYFIWKGSSSEGCFYNCKIIELFVHSFRFKYFNLFPFYQASRGIDKDLADQHSILRSWAIKDFAPNTPQFVQLFRPENKINIKFAGNERIYTIYKNLKEK